MHMLTINKMIIFYITKPILVFCMVSRYMYAQRRDGVQQLIPLSAMLKCKGNFPFRNPLKFNLESLKKA